MEQAPHGILRTVRSGGLIICLASEGESARIWIKTYRSDSQPKAATEQLLPREQRLAIQKPGLVFPATGGLWTGNPAFPLTLLGPEPSCSPLCGGVLSTQGRVSSPRSSSEEQA